MSTNKGLNPENLKLIDASEVPTKTRRYTPYREILKRIKKGKALVVTDDEANVDTVRAGIRRLQEHGEFTRVIITQRKNEHGVRMLYVINPSDEEPKKTPPLHLQS